MTSRPDSKTEAETLRSPALYLGRVVVPTRADDRGALLSGTRLKGAAFPALHWLIRHTPRPVALLPARLVTVLLRLRYFLPGYRLRAACLAISHLRGHGDARRIHRRFLGNALDVIANFVCLYQQGRASVLPRIYIADEDVERVRRLTGQHGGVILAVPHNVASAFSALRIGHCFDMLLVAKNPRTAARTRIALDFYERMHLSVLMVRGGNPFELSRTLFSVLRKGKLVAATLDNQDRSANAVQVRMFGQTVGLPGWAARIAARRQVPVVPAWFHSTGRDIRVLIGRPILSDDVARIVQHYADFFQQHILEDPESWAYLADKHWQALLARACESAQVQASSS